MFALHKVGRRFPNGTEALRDVCLTVEGADFIALLGPSGCGKSTLLRLIAGLDRPDTGAIRWTAGAPPTPGRIGFVFQDPTLLPWATAAQNVRLPLRLQNIPAARSDPLVASALARVGLASFAAAHPRELSGGMRMRVSIARSLVLEPDLLLMDEPFAALDEFTRHRLQEDLLAVSAGSSRSVVFVTHSIYEAAFLARRIILMSPRPGRIAQEITADLPPGPARRLSSEYAALVAQITEAMHAVRKE